MITKLLACIFSLLVAVPLLGEEKLRTRSEITLDKENLTLKWTAKDGTRYTIDYRRGHMTDGNKSYPLKEEEVYGMLMFFASTLLPYTEDSEEWFQKGGVYPSDDKGKDDAETGVATTDRKYEEVIIEESMWPDTESMWPDTLTISDVFEGSETVASHLAAPDLPPPEGNVCCIWKPKEELWACGSTDPAREIDVLRARIADLETRVGELARWWEKREDPPCDLVVLNDDLWRCQP